MKPHNKVIEFLISLLFPRRCPFCKALIESNEYACKRCMGDFPKYAVTQGVKGGYRCCSPLLYKDKYRKAVLNFKYHHKRIYAVQFAPLLHKAVEQSYPDMIFDYITFVPMHKKDIRKRKFNHSELLAKELSRLMGIPCYNTLEKIKETQKQHEVSAQERKNNLNGAFKVVDKDLVEARSILIVDDIVTTGATLGECAKTLQKAHPSHICCVTLNSVANLY